MKKLITMVFIAIMPSCLEAQNVKELELIPDQTISQSDYKIDKPHPVSIVGGTIGAIGFFALLFTGVIVYEEDQFSIGWDNIDFDTAEISGAGMLLASIPIVLVGEGMDKKRKAQKTIKGKKRNSPVVCTTIYSTPTGFSTHSIRIPSIGVHFPLSK